MRKIADYAGSAVNRIVKALIGQDHYPVGGVLDIGWQTGIDKDTRGDQS